VPGIMSAINNVFSENNLNVSAQYLQTNDAIGYVVIDIDAEYSDMALAKLAAIEGTIRSRVLF
jgi:D-3-phosphoglycerate dehydrogenase